MVFVDTNVFIRALIADNVSMHSKAVDFFRKVNNEEINCFVEDSVIAEVIFVLTSKKLYNLPRSEVAARIVALLSMKNVYHNYKTELITALNEFAETNLDFVDCLAISYKNAGVVKDIFSFDKKMG